MPRRHDQSYKLLFSVPLAIEHLIRGFVSERLADELDFGRTESLATERTTPGLVRSGEMLPPMLAITIYKGANDGRHPLHRAYPGMQHVRLREAFREWILGAAESWGSRPRCWKE